MGDEGKVGCLFMALTGVGRHLRHYLGIRKGGANCKIIFDSSIGAGSCALCSPAVQLESQSSCLEVLVMSTAAQYGSKVL
jgi:hypothetical protein